MALILPRLCLVPGRPYEYNHKGDQEDEEKAGTCLEQTVYSYRRTGSLPRTSISVSHTSSPMGISRRNAPISCLASIQLSTSSLGYACALIPRDPGTRLSTRGLGDVDALRRIARAFPVAQKGSNMHSFEMERARAPSVYAVSARCEPLADDVVELETTRLVVTARGQVEKAGSLFTPTKNTRPCGHVLCILTFSSFLFARRVGSI